MAPTSAIVAITGPGPAFAGSSPARSRVQQIAGKTGPAASLATHPIQSAASGARTGVGSDSAVWEKVSKVAQPPVNGCPPGAAKPLEPLHRRVRMPPLAQGADQHHYRCPVYPALPETHRWRQYPTPATVTAAAQAEANLERLIQIRGTPSRFARIVGMVQRSPAIGQRRHRVFSASSRSIL